MVLTRPVRGWLRKTIGSLGPRLGTEIRMGSKMPGRGKSCPQTRRATPRRIIDYPRGRGAEGLGTRLGRDNPTPPYIGSEPDSQK